MVLIIVSAQISDTSNAMSIWCGQCGLQLYTAVQWQLHTDESNRSNGSSIMRAGVTSVKWIGLVWRYHPGYSSSAARGSGVRAQNRGHTLRLLGGVVGCLYMHYGACLRHWLVVSQCMCTSSGVGLTIVWDNTHTPLRRYRVHSGTLYHLC
jgi:hypothetical protein